MKLFLCDLDGTLTNATYEITGRIPAYAEKNPDCVISLGKTFFTRDFVGFRLLHERGIEVGVVTGWENDPIIKHQFGRFPFIRVITSAQNKVKSVEQAFSDWWELPADVDWGDIAYIGDDINDIELLDKVGMAACPGDAEDEVLSFIHEKQDGWVMTRGGGH